MKVLWFEVSVPAKYRDDGRVIGGWQDSLERIVRKCPEIELTISFKYKERGEKKKDDGVTYYPMHLNFSVFDKLHNRISWDVEVKQLEKEMLKVVNDVKPDIIQVFGTEWPYGHIAKFTDIPVVVHIMGALVPYMNAKYPPGYSFLDIWRCNNIFYLKRTINSLLDHIKERSWVNVEKEVWKNVRYYMGRTRWDKSLSGVLHPGRLYFHVDEGLRSLFLDGRSTWEGYNNKQIELISTGCSTFWKGPDMMLKVAKILTELEIKFIWRIVGKMDETIRKIVEKKEDAKYTDNNILFVGSLKPDELRTLLCKSSIYVHTAYIENSPNSICEAQCLGLPIISTNVGGISSLVKDGVEGVLVPANDPWQMADAIIELAADKDRMQLYSTNCKCRALKRHRDDKILNDLVCCYESIVSNSNLH